jgi:hypothetical protein
MFGTLRPHRCTLDPISEQDHRAFYCGLCHGLAAQHGQASRVMVGRDAVFVAVVVDGLLPGETGMEPRRCPMVPIRRREVAAARGVATRYAVAVQALLADQWLADRAADGGRVAGAGRAVLSRTTARARADLDHLGVPLSRLEGFEQRQLDVERPGVTRPAEAAGPTADALGWVFAGIADLPGANLDRWRVHLRGLGRSLGRVIYLADALDDLRSDLLRGRFNPCLVGGDEGFTISRRRVSDAEALLRTELEALDAGIAALPWQRHRALVDNVLGDRLRRDSLASARRARRWASPAGTVELRHWRTRPRVLRAAVVALAVMLNVWSWTRRAAAAVIAGRASPRELWQRIQEDDGRGGFCDVLVDWLRALFEECCEAVGDCCDDCSGSCSGCCGACDQCEGSCDDCSGCCDVCDDCDGNCDSCCDGCDDCGGCCNDCDGCCNDCG